MFWITSIVKFQTYYYAALNNSDYSFAYSIADTDTVRLSQQIQKIFFGPSWTFFLGGPRGQVIKAANLKHSLTTVGSSLARVTCETSQVLLACGQVVFLRDLLFLPHLTIDSAQKE